jgi:hypothetical protein
LCDFCVLRQQGVVTSSTSAQLYCVMSFVIESVIRCYNGMLILHNVLHYVHSQFVCIDVDIDKCALQQLQTKCNSAVTYALCV